MLDLLPLPYQSNRSTWICKEASRLAPRQISYTALGSIRSSDDDGEAGI
jgi:hypothetical protein